MSRNDYSLRAYFVEPMVSFAVSDLIRKLPAMIVEETDLFCDYYIQANVSPVYAGGAYAQLQSEKQSSNASLSKPSNASKYRNRSQKMICKAIKNNNEHAAAIHTDDKPVSKKSDFECLQEQNPQIVMLSESDFIQICEPMIDDRCDSSSVHSAAANQPQISLYLMAEHRAFPSDYFKDAYHTNHLEQFHFGGDYGPGYQGSLFIAPEDVRNHLQQQQHQTESSEEYDSVPHESDAKHKEKVCHGCRRKYIVSQWDEHVASEAHQQYLNSPMFEIFCQYIDEVNAALKDDENKLKNSSPSIAPDCEKESRSVSVVPVVDLTTHPTTNTNSVAPPSQTESQQCTENSDKQILNEISNPTNNVTEGLGRRRRSKRKQNANATTHVDDASTTCNSKKSKITKSETNRGQCSQQKQRVNQVNLPPLHLNGVEHFDDTAFALDIELIQQESSSKCTRRGTYSSLSNIPKTPGAPASNRTRENKTRRNQAYVRKMRKHKQSRQNTTTIGLRLAMQR